MNICVDVGNSTIVIAAYKNNVLVGRALLLTDTNLTYEQLSSLLRHCLRESIPQDDVRNIIYSSVVPQIDQNLITILRDFFELEPMILNSHTKTDLAVDVDNPLEIGNDLIADLVAAKEKYGYPCLIADLGTASKILLLNKEGTFTSCLIMPGLTMSAASLTDKAALLPHVSLDAPSSILAKNTMNAMNAGIVYGHVDMIIGLINRYEKALGYQCKRILTGGGAIHVKDLIGDDFIYDRDLNTDGLNIIINKNNK